MCINTYLYTTAYILYITVCGYVKYRILFCIQFHRTPFLVVVKISVNYFHLSSYKSILLYSKLI